jgi:hypothetical protein
VHELGCDQPSTIKELLDIATRHASGKEAVGTAFVLGNMKVAARGSHAPPPKTTAKGTRKGAKGSKKGQKRCPQCVMVTTSDDDDDEEVDDSSKEYVVATERDFKHQAWQLKDHFGKLLEATYLNHLYHVKHKLMDCTMIKNFMTSELPLEARSPRESREGRAWYLISGRRCDIPPLRKDGQS